MLIISAYALFNGNVYYNKQVSVIHKLKEKDSIVLETILQNFKIDTTGETNDRLYKNASKSSWAIFDQHFNVYWNPSVASVICIGNRDIYPYYQEIVPVSLYMRLFKNEISNPNMLLIGNIDFSYVIIFVFPLFIVSLLFNLLSEDKEKGLGLFLYTNAESVQRFIFARLISYIIIILSILLMLFAFAFLFLIGNIDCLVELFIFSSIYSLFWVVVCYMVNLIGRSSVFNISFLISIWLTFSLLIPSASNQLASIKYPINTEEISKTMRRVQLSDADHELQAVLNKFYARYPQYSNPDTTATNLFSRAYVAQGQLSDLEGDQLLNGICEKMLQKQNFLKNVAYFNPSMYLQQKFANETETNLTDYVWYLKRIQQFNLELKEFYFKKIFTDDKMSIDYYKTLPKWK